MKVQVEEGLCQVISMKYLEKQTDLCEKDSCVSTSARAALQNESTGNDALQLAYFRSRIENDPTSTYGDGFRDAAAACSALGIQIVIDHIRETRALPDV